MINDLTNETTNGTRLRQILNNNVVSLFKEYIALSHIMKQHKK